MEALATFMHSLGTRVTLWLVGKHGVQYVLGATLGLAVIGAAATAQTPTKAQTQPATVQPSAAPAPQPYHHCDGDR
jgi:hypothetical protein